jgi:hypothetical protein
MTDFREWRDRHNLTQQAAADLLGLSYRTVTAMERPWLKADGRRNWGARGISAETLAKMADVDADGHHGAPRKSG